MKRDEPCTIAQRMKEQRKTLGKTQKDIADKSGLSTKTINNLEHMTAPTMTVDTFIKLCDALECSADYLLGKDALPTHELTDIHALTGLSEDAIRELISRHTEHNEFDHEPYSMFSSEERTEAINLISDLIINMDDTSLLKAIRNSAYSLLADYEWEEVIEPLHKEILEELFSIHPNEEDISIYTDESEMLRRNMDYYSNASLSAQWKLSQWFNSTFDRYLEVRKHEASESIEAWYQAKGKGVFEDEKR